MLYLFCVLATASAMAQQTTRDYMVRAIDAGEASGVLNDDAATLWRQQTGSSSPVNIRVKVIKDFKQPGCKRLAVVMEQSNVPTKDRGFVVARMPFEMNLCRDGAPPMEGADLDALRRRAAEQQAVRQSGHAR